MIIESSNKDPERIATTIAQQVKIRAEEWIHEKKPISDFISCNFSFFGWNDAEVFRAVTVLWLKKSCGNHITLFHQSTEDSPSIQIWIPRRFSLLS